MLDLLNTVFKYKEKRSPDKLGLYPEAVHTNAMPERRYLWSARLLVIFAALSICLNIVLVSSIYIMLPQTSATPLLFEHDSVFSKLQVIQQQEQPIAAVDLLTESFIEEFILRRHVITADYDELMMRWGKGSRLFWMSSSRVYQSFAVNDIKNNIRCKRRNNNIINSV